MNVFPHDNFDSFNLYNNICVMKLEEPLDLSEDRIAQAGLPIQGQNFSGDATVSGWGTTSPADTDVRGMMATTKQITATATTTEAAAETTTKQKL